MRRERFEDLVAEALAGLPEEFRERLDNVDVEVADWPTIRQLARGRVGRRWQLLGLYEGIPLTRRDAGYDMVLPDRITIFRRPIELICRSEEEIVRQVRKTVIHEIGHHFGIDDERLRELEEESERG